MIIVNQCYEIDHWHPMDDFERIVKAARLCYQSEPLDSRAEQENFLRRLIKKGHLSPFEHSSLSVIFTTNRGVTHELVRHRLASYSQESTRYCNYSKDKFKNGSNYDNVCYFDSNSGVTFISDPCISANDRSAWLDNLRASENAYLNMLDLGYSPQIARGILPNDLKTQIIVTTNLLEWRHIFKLRCDKSAHPHMRELMIPLLTDVQSKIPVVFDDILEGVFGEA